MLLSCCQLSAIIEKTLSKQQKAIFNIRETSENTKESLVEDSWHTFLDYLTKGKKDKGIPKPMNHTFIHGAKRIHPTYQHKKQMHTLWIAGQKGDIGRLKSRHIYSLCKNKVLLDLKEKKKVNLKSCGRQKHTEKVDLEKRAPFSLLTALFKKAIKGGELNHFG
ncbi:hypothetical protein L6164_001366 [Bauhinia variegata]|uniref:Uncharacterized protein n=1 Tax=Bauhinia variegata TaxID=167791 RepID=A0ACB9Q9I1_BAUVA|nr:hypothetical protein L6164_001366 [Bauhinia variegata]